MLCGNLPCLNKDAKFNVWECRAHLLLLIWVSQERDNMEISCRWQGYHRFRNISSCRTTKGFWIGQRYTARFEWIMRVMQAGLIYGMNREIALDPTPVSPRPDVKRHNEETRYNQLSNCGCISKLLSFGFLFGRFWNYVKITFLFQLIISCCSQLETVGTMGETLRVKAGEDAIKRVQQGFDKVAKEKQMNGSVLLLIISVDRPSCWMWVGLFGWRVTQSWPGRRTVSQHRLHTVLRDALLRNMLGFGICLVLHPAHRWYKNLI